MKSICFALLLMMGMATGVRGQASSTNINPALTYYRALLLESKIDRSEKDYLLTNVWTGQKLPPEFGRRLAPYGTVLTYLRRAAQAKAPCDWGIDVGPDGLGTMLPHLAGLKASATVMCLDARWELERGNQAAAGDDLLAAFTLARNIARDHMTISALLQIAIENIVLKTVAENFYQFSPETLKRLAEGFEAAPTRGTIAACMRTEKIGFCDWLTDRIRKLRESYPGDDAKVMEGIRGQFDDLEGQAAEALAWKKLVAASGGTSEGIIKLIKEVEAYYERLTKITALPLAQYETEMNRCIADVDKSTNPFLRLLLPSLWKAHEKEFRVYANLAMVRAAIEYKLHGEPGLKSVPDPFGTGPLAFRRFKLENVDRGFELKSAYAKSGYQETIIFVEKAGPPFIIVMGSRAGQGVDR